MGTSYDMDTSGKAFLEHWDWAAEKGAMNKNTAGALKGASSQVLSILEDWESRDIREINVEEILVRFQNLRGKEYKPQTLNAYKRRFSQAVEYFLDYVNDPTSWKPIANNRPTSRSANSGRTKSKKSSNTEAHESARTVIPQPPAGGLVPYPYPLRENLVVYLYLPADLKAVEVKRLAAFMTTLTVDFEVSIVDH